MLDELSSPHPDDRDRVRLIDEIERVREPNALPIPEAVVVVLLQALLDQSRRVRIRILQFLAKVIVRFDSPFGEVNVGVHVRVFGQICRLASVASLSELETELCARLLGDHGDEAAFDSMPTCLREHRCFQDTLIERAAVRDDTDFATKAFIEHLKTNENPRMRALAADL